MLVLYLSNEIMSLIIQLSTLLLIVVFSITFPNKKKAMMFGVCSMLLANVLGQLVVAGEGPAFCVGFVILPFWGILVAYVSIIIRGKIKGPATIEAKLQN